MEKKNTGLIVLVIILSLLVIGLGGYIVYDKVLSKEGVSTQNNNVVNNASSEKSYSYNEVAGLYTYTAKTFEEGTDDEFIPIYKLYLYDNGGFFYLRPSRTPLGVVGNYIIKDNKIVLNYWYNWSNGIQKLNDEDIKTNSLIIKEDGNLLDSNPFKTWYDLSEISLSKGSSDEENDFIHAFGDFSKIINLYLD